MTKQTRYPRNFKKTVKLAIAILIGLIGAYSQIPKNSLTKPLNQNLADQNSISIKVIDVIDGDTIKLANGQNLRYIGIDTPETKIKEGQRFVPKPQPFSLEAAQLNKDLVEGKTVRVEFDVTKTDKYNRLLGYCFIGDTFVNAEILRQGLAVTYTYPPNIKYTDILLTAQKEAKDNKRGLWGDYAVISSDQAFQYIDQVRTVKGRVINAHKAKSCIYLNLSSSDKKDFTVVIYNNTLELFSQAGITPTTFYNGKTIEVTGRLRQYKGQPEIIANGPQEIIIARD